MDRMPEYIPARDRVVRLDRRRGHALFEFVRQLADDGDDRAGSFLDALRAGAFDDPPRDSGLRLFVRPYTVGKPENPHQ
jgi:hypothetical protein